jgi:hypothetical protein
MTIPSTFPDRSFRLVYVLGKKNLQFDSGKVTNKRSLPGRRSSRLVSQYCLVSACEANGQEKRINPRR